MQINIGNRPWYVKYNNATKVLVTVKDISVPNCATLISNYLRETSFDAGKREFLLFDPADESRQKDIRRR